MLAIKGFFLDPGFLVRKPLYYVGFILLYNFLGPALKTGQD